jgi:hypothetical protein
MLSHRVTYDRDRSYMTLDKGHVKH